MENHEYGQILGSPEAPFLDRMAKEGVVLSREFAVTHPSLPNYLALLGGSTFGITSDCTTCHVSASNLVDQLEASGRTWRAYLEGMPSPCFPGAAFGRYAKKHDPFLYFDDIRNRPGRCRNVVPLGRLGADLASNRLPGFAWISPDLCHDMHDCPVSEGDRFLSTWVPRIRPSLGADGVLVVTFDEGTTDAGCCDRASGGHVAAVIWGPGARSGVVLASAADHYSLLRMVEDAWGLTRLRSASCPCTPTVEGWRRP